MTLDVLTDAGERVAEVQVVEWTEPGPAQGRRFGVFGADRRADLEEYFDEVEAVVEAIRSLL